MDCCSQIVAVVPCLLPEPPLSLPTPSLLPTGSPPTPSTSPPACPPSPPSPRQPPPQSQSHHHPVHSPPLHYRGCQQRGQQLPKKNYRLISASRPNLLIDLLLSVLAPPVPSLGTPWPLSSPTLPVSAWSLAGVLPDASSSKTLITTLSCKASTTSIPPAH